MQARYYDPVMGRFLSIDPVGYSGGVDTGQFGRYTYTFNNPINAMDPDGKCTLTEDKYGCRIISVNEGSNDSRRDNSKKLIKTSAGLIRNSLGKKSKDAQFDISGKTKSIKQAGRRIMRSATGKDAGTIAKAIAQAVKTGEPQSIHTTLGGLQTGIVGVGEANFTLDGVVTVDENQWILNGVITGTGEQFDFNPKPSGQRARGAEGATRAGRQMEKAGLVRGYHVDYLGGFNITSHGDLPANMLPDQ